jgi:hypothetical protein
MVLRQFVGLLFAAALAFNAAAEVVVQVAPPQALVEKRGPAPGAEYAWIAGYHRWTATHTCGLRADGNSLHGRMPIG